LYKHHTEINHEKNYLPKPQSSHKPGGSLPVLAVAHGSTGLAQRSTMPHVACGRVMLRNIHT
ncbi:hypothetical protein ACIQVE_19750, partial [Pseudomonas sp. NPDC098747]|uniref:hypothetical protein n=1 Tax=Pseudomonas sp. NPDC098747 TaxID=3364487 RepID=UPI00383A0BC9